jgi:cytochrome c oxidase cbb3-type subunit 3
MKSKKYLMLCFWLVSAVSLWAQSATTQATPSPQVGQLPQIMTWVLISIGALLFMVAMLYMINVNQFLYKRALQLEARLNNVILPDGNPAIVSDPAGDDFWTRLRKKYWEDAVPIDREGEIILHHNYDGIRELDNRLPPWWVNMFALTIVYGLGYMVYYHWGGSGATQVQEYEQEVATAKKEIALALAGKANAVDESNVVAVTETGQLGEGELIFKGNCVACHGQKGEGGVGPNFTDEYWLHGGGIKDLFKTIKYGVPEKGMISWQSQLKPSDMQKVASYILTLKGTNPPNPKAPQGVIWKETATPQDSIAKKDILPSATK